MPFKQTRQSLDRLPLLPKTYQTIATSTMHKCLIIDTKLESQLESVEKAQSLQKNDEIDDDDDDDDDEAVKNLGC